MNVFVSLRAPALLAALAIVTFSGCASSTTRQAPAPVASTRLSESNKAGEVVVRLSDEGREKLKDNLKFNQDELRQHIERALTAYSLLNPDKTPGLPVVEVVVTSMRVRSNFSAVAFGFMAGGDNITGDIVIRDAAGKETDRFHVSATYALGGLAGGQDEARMGWLYEAFAKRVIEEITGVKAK